MEKTGTLGSFTEGKILGPLAKFALPVLLALLLQTMYGAADLLIVGEFCEAAAISAVSTGSLVMQTITQVITGLAMGTTVMVARRIGENRSDEAGSVIGGSIALFALLGIVVSVLMQPLAEPVARLLNAPEVALADTVAYLRICGGGAVFIVGYNVLGSIFRGLGNSRMPLFTVTIACILNILGDLLLVGVFGMGASGAAIATVFAQAVSVLLSFLMIRRMQLPFAFSRKMIRLREPAVGGVLRLGWPIALEDLLVSISFLVITAIVNDLGVLASAGVGVAEKVCSFIMLVPSAFAQSMSAFVAQNAGAGRYDRARSALRCGILISLAAGVLMAWLSFFHGDLFSGIFSPEAAVVENAWQYLRSYAIDCLFVPFYFCFVGYFNGLGKTGFVMVQGLVGAFGVRIPAAYLMSQIQPASLFLIGLSTPASTLTQILLCVGYYIYCQRHYYSARRDKLPAPEQT